jgi:hypothetical protein
LVAATTGAGQGGHTHDCGEDCGDDRGRFSNEPEDGWDILRADLDLRGPGPHHPFHLDAPVAELQLAGLEGQISDW